MRKVDGLIVVLAELEVDEGEPLRGRIEKDIRLREVVVAEDHGAGEGFALSTHPRNLRH